MAGSFPPIEPYDSGLLDVGDGHEVYWECCGNPKGKPALFLHGGPGSGSSPGQRRFFDPSIYRAVLYDQRGSGRSRPLASRPNTNLSLNTTAHLIADIEALRQLHGVERWTILGLSWGTTLGLAYAQSYPQRVSALVLGLVTTTSRREVEWITRGVGCIFPQEWDHFAAAVPHELRHLPLVDAYAGCCSIPTRRSRITPRARGAPGKTRNLPHSRLSAVPQLRRLRVSPPLRALGHALLAPLRFP